MLKNIADIKQIEKIMKIHNIEQKDNAFISKVIEEDLLLKIYGFVAFLIAAINLSR